MKQLLIGLCLWASALPACAQNIRIRNHRFEGAFLVRHGHVHVLLEPFSAALGARLAQAGEGYWGSLEEGQAPAPVAAGVVLAGGQSIPLLLESGDVFVPAEAYCQALGLSIRRDAGGALCVGSRPQAHNRPAARVPSDPAEYFVTQYQSRYNQWGPKTSANCGPACMAMVALAYQLAPQGLLPGDRQGLIQWCRQAMTLGSQDLNRATKCREIERVATQLGLTSHWIRRFQDLDQALAAGQLVVVAGDTTKIGREGGGHFLLCVGRRGSDYIINDPGGFFPNPAARVSEGTMEQFFLEAIALYPSSP